MLYIWPKRQSILGKVLDFVTKPPTPSFQQAICYSIYYMTYFLCSCHNFCFCSRCLITQDVWTVCFTGVQSQRNSTLCLFLLCSLWRADCMNFSKGFELYLCHRTSKENLHITALLQSSIFSINTSCCCTPWRSFGKALFLGGQRCDKKMTSIQNIAFMN